MRKKSRFITTNSGNSDRAGPAAHKIADNETNAEKKKYQKSVINKIANNVLNEFTYSLWLSLGQRRRLDSVGGIEFDSGER